jgi:hypothetical protein
MRTSKLSGTESVGRSILPAMRAETSYAPAGTRAARRDALDKKHAGFVYAKAICHFVCCRMGVDVGCWRVPVNTDADKNMTD